MIKLRDILIFLAGATFFHGVSHAVLPYYITLPWNVGFMVLTQNLNYAIIVGSLVVTILLLWGAKKLSR